MKKSLLVILCLSLALALPASAIARGSHEGGLFGYRETMRPVLKKHPFRSWARVIDDHIDDLRRMQDCADTKIGPCRVARWFESVEYLKNASIEKKLRRVNSKLNDNPYLTDIRNWGIEDYWETPLEFLKRRGDCEDYAISKYETLKFLGVDPSQMRIVVVTDTNLGINHAVLVVRVEDKNYVLDNQTDHVIDSRRIRHYRPLYSVNETGWWLHS